MRFPTITKTCAQYGIDIASQMIPIAPAAHYMMGGVQTNLNGETSVKGLYACGESACQGVHGANRLASNSLLDGLVYGHRIVEHSKPLFAEKHETQHADFTNSELYPCNHGALLGVKENVQRLMWEKVGIVRKGQDLSEATRELEQMENVLQYEACNPEDVETYNTLTVGRLIAQAALIRTESRGGHFRQDFVQRDDVHWKKHVVFQRNPGGEVRAFEHEFS